MNRSSWIIICLAYIIGLFQNKYENPHCAQLIFSFHNTYFMECLRQRLDQNNCALVIPTKEIIDYKEAILMALMAKEYLQSNPNVLSNVTGASSSSVGGALHKVLS